MIISKNSYITDFTLTFISRLNSFYEKIFCKKNFEQKTDKTFSLNLSENTYFSPKIYKELKT